MREKKEKLEGVRRVLEHPQHRKSSSVHRKVKLKLQRGGGRVRMIWSRRRSRVAGKAPWREQVH